MTWLIDVGNTRVKAARQSESGGLGEVRALVHTSPEFVPALQALAAEIGPSQPVWLASVAAPELTYAVECSLKAAGAIVMRAQVRGCAGLSLGSMDVRQLGVDRFLAVLGAWQQGPGPWLVVSIGSALTVDLLDDTGQHRGGLIAATPEHQRQALATRFPALDREGGIASDFATTTADALASGALASALGLIERCHRQASVLLASAPALWLCGGGAEEVSAALGLAHRVEPYLVLQGLARYASSHRTSA